MNNQIFLSKTALERTTDALLPYEVAALFDHGRIVFVGEALMDRKKYCCWNPFSHKILNFIVSNDGCVVTMQEGRPELFTKQDILDIKRDAYTPRYLEEFAGSVGRTFDVTIITQVKSSRPNSGEPHVSLVSKVYRHNKANYVWQLLKDRALYSFIMSICGSLDPSCIPVGLMIDGVKIPLSSVFERKNHKRKIIFPWSFSQ